MNAAPKGDGADSGPGTGAARRAFGEVIRTQRRLANMTLRQLSEMSSVSNAYLSQIERGLHQPSVNVLTSIARALDLSAETLFAQAAGLEREGAPEGASGPSTTEAAIRNDPYLGESQKEALLSVYRSLRAITGPTDSP